MNFVSGQIDFFSEHLHPKKHQKQGRDDVAIFSLNLAGGGVELLCALVWTIATTRGELSCAETGIRIAPSIREEQGDTEASLRWGRSRAALWLNLPADGSSRRFS